MNQWEQTMRERTGRFAVDVTRFVRSLPDEAATQALRRQLIQAAGSVAANYRSACRARSHAEFTAKLGVVLEEADEAEGWLDMLHETGGTRSPELVRLRRESKELRAIFFAANRTARRPGHGGHR